MILICVYFFSQGYFTNPQLLQATLSKTGILAPLLFILLQIIQVIIPIIPGGASMLGYYSLWSSQWIYI